MFFKLRATAVRVAALTAALAAASSGSVTKIVFGVSTAPSKRLVKVINASSPLAATWAMISATNSRTPASGRARRLRRLTNRAYPGSR